MFAHKLWYLLFLIFALIVGAWSARTQLAELAISSFMQDYGLDKITVNISRLDINQSQLPRLDFSIVTENGLLKFAAQDISINYTIGQLTEGQLDRVTIKHLSLHHENNGKTPDTSNTIHKNTEPHKIIVALRQGLSKYLFVNTLFIQQLTLNGEPFALFEGKSLSLKSMAENEILSAELSLFSPPTGAQPETLPQLVITKLSANSLSTELRLMPASTTADSKTIAGFTLNIQDTEITGNYQFNPADLQRWLQPFVSIKNLNKIENVNGTVLINIDAGKHIPATFTATIDSLLYKAFNVDNIELKLKLSSITDSPDQSIQVLNGSYVKADNFSYDNFMFKASPLYMVAELTNTGNGWLSSGGFKSDLFLVKDTSRALQLKDISARFTASSKQLDMSGNFSPATLPGKFGFALDHSLTKRHGKLSITPLKALDLNDDNSSLSQLLLNWPYPFELLSGNIKLALDARWSQNDAFRLITKIDVDNAGGNIDKLVFSGLNFNHELEILPRLQSSQASKIRLKTVDSGVVLSNINSSLLVKTAKTGANPQLVIEGLNGEIFGGTFSGENLTYDLNRSRNNFKLKATNIDLAEILKTQQFEDITATGRISGFIPVEINKNGVFIEDGAFVNDISNGTIRYNPTSGADQLKQNPLTGIALDALKDFRYSHLSAGVNFTAEGRLTINLRLIGTSPELETNRPVHLNINTEQNLFSLLKSLRYAQGVSDNIDEKVRRLYEKMQK